MKKLIFILGIFFIGLTLTSTSSCSPKVGCELNESMAPATNRRGELKTKRGNSSLFDKKTRKRMGYN